MRRKSFGRLSRKNETNCTVIAQSAHNAHLKLKGLFLQGERDRIMGAPLPPSGGLSSSGVAHISEARLRIPVTTYNRPPKMSSRVHGPVSPPIPVPQRRALLLERVLFSPRRISKK